ncbi:uncharacterized protein MYCFIDRAFT_210438 [Pseudocercospora fijiensis CIRAD86]|uniref:Uncharacterized protein n=1 Tax=Pseudocercospora fijiensis (strain CIRAD86) TaxID=383855 RepID=M3ANP5_PSEFD|nr:uncharacterized protein MYCFIDRAFT_210438 [Pseudocercospora fijiensis CIRAD86]EME86211.1 hypothetical protein MYCFIDRAFT_210438 [Pseudocercospora fijiensis CIRAD86]
MKLFSSLLPILAISFSIFAFVAAGVACHKQGAPCSHGSKGGVYTQGTVGIIGGGGPFAKVDNGMGGCDRRKGGC